MQYRFIVLSMACLSCLLPPARGLGIVAKTAVIGAVKGAILGGIKGAAVGAGVGLAANGLLAKAGIKSDKLLADNGAAFKGTGAIALRGLSSIMTLKSALGASSKGTSTSECKSSNNDTPNLEMPTVLDVLNYGRSSSGNSEDQTKQPVVYRIISEPRLIAVPYKAGEN